MAGCQENEFCSNVLNFLERLDDTIRSIGKDRTGRTDYSAAGEGMTKRVVSEPFGTFSHHIVTKRVEVTKSADSASDMTRFVTLVTKRAATPLPASHHVISRQGASRLVVSLQLRERAKENWQVTYSDHFATRFRHVSDVTHITKCLVSNPLLSLGAMVLLGYRSTLTLSLSLVRHNYDVNGQVLSSV